MPRPARRKHFHCALVTIVSMSSVRQTVTFPHVTLLWAHFSYVGTTYVLIDGSQNERIKINNTHILFHPAIKYSE